MRYRCHINLSHGFIGARSASNTPPNKFNNSTTSLSKCLSLPVSPSLGLTIQASQTSNWQHGSQQGWWDLETPQLGHWLRCPTCFPLHQPHPKFTTNCTRFNSRFDFCDNRLRWPFCLFRQRLAYCLRPSDSAKPCVIRTWVNVNYLCPTLWSSTMGVRVKSLLWIFSPQPSPIYSDTRSRRVILNSFFYAPVDLRRHWIEWVQSQDPHLLSPRLLQSPLQPDSCTSVAFVSFFFHWCCDAYQHLIESSSSLRRTLSTYPNCLNNL